MCPCKRSQLSPSSTTNVWMYASQPLVSVMWGPTTLAKTEAKRILTISVFSSLLGKFPSLFSNGPLTSPFYINCKSTSDFFPISLKEFKLSSCELSYQVSMIAVAFIAHGFSMELPFFLFVAHIICTVMHALKVSGKLYLGFLPLEKVGDHSSLLW